MTTGLPEEFEVLWDDGEFISSRVRHHPNHSSTLLVQPAVAHPTVAHHRAIARHQAQLATWAATCAETFGSRSALAAAELARLEDRVLDAEDLYEKALRSASTAGFANIEALASEIAGQFYRVRGFERIAQTYLASAHSCY